MKNWLDKMERRFGRYAIRNLTMYLLAGYAIGYLLSFTMKVSPCGSEIPLCFLFSACAYLPSVAQTRLRLRQCA